MAAFYLGPIPVYMIPNVSILKAGWTAQSELIPVYTNKSQEQTPFIELVERQASQRGKSRSAEDQEKGKRKC